MHKPKILIADDDQNVRTAFRTRLHQSGYRVVESSNGLDVLSQYLSEYVDAVILDHDMPVGDGRTIARMIRRESDAPIIFISGFDVDKFKPLMRELPDVYFFSKPIDFEELGRLLKNITGESVEEAGVSGDSEGRGGSEY